MAKRAKEKSKDKAAKMTKEVQTQTEATVPRTTPTTGIEAPKKVTKEVAVQTDGVVPSPRDTTKPGKVSTSVQTQETHEQELERMEAESMGEGVMPSQK